MTTRCWPTALAVVCSFVSAAPAARTFRTKNFEVRAPRARLARQVARAAERYRKKVARLWLGKELPAWPSRCPVRVKLTEDCGGRSYTSFLFDEGRLVGQEMHLEGPAWMILRSVLPHEVTHAVLAHHFRRPLPRWADEGAAVLSEDREAWEGHERALRKVLSKPGRAIPLGPGGQSSPGSRPPASGPRRRRTGR
jgi:hypothetical protein